MVSNWKEKEFPLKCQRVAEINTVISLVLEEFDIDRIQKKFHQVDVATEADHVVDVPDHVTVAPAQEYIHLFCYVTKNNLGWRWRPRR